MSPRTLPSFPAVVLGTALLAGPGCYYGASADVETRATSSADTAEEGEDTDSGSPGGDGNDGEEPPAVDCNVAPAKLWKLSPEQYGRTISLLIPGLEEDFGDAIRSTTGSAGRFSNALEGVQMSQAHVEDLFFSAERLASEVLARPATLSACAAESIEDAACIEAALVVFLERAFRRPVEEGEGEYYISFYRSQREPWDAERALHSTLSSVFMAPSFLFRTEIGDGTAAPGEVFPLTSFERASALSYLISDGPPDEELMSDARNGELDDPEVVREHARRLLSKPGSAQGLRQFFEEQFKLSEVLSATKDPELFADFDDELATEMYDELSGFVDHVMWEDDGRFETLMTSTHGVQSDSLATRYGVTVGEPLDPTKYSGLLTRAGMMAALSRDNETDIIARGRFVREEIVCQTLPPPPPDVSAVPPPLDEDATHRERLSEHSEDPTCQGCHRLMDPIGFAFEHYDPVGIYQELDNGKPIDASGVFENVDIESIAFGNGVEFSQVVSTLPAAQDCIATRFATYATGEDLHEDRCEMIQFRELFDASEGDFIHTLANFAASPSALWRRAAE